MCFWAGLYVQQWAYGVVATRRILSQVVEDAAQWDRLPCTDWPDCKQRIMQVSSVGRYNAPICVYPGKPQPVERRNR